MLDLDQAIRERHSTRLFLPQPVPRELVNEALALAQYAPSNSNIQPWHMVFASGASRDRLVAALIDEAGVGRRIFRPCLRRFSISAASWALKSTGRWESLARTQRDTQLQSCATGNFSAHQWQVLFACTATSAQRTPSVSGCSCKRCCWL